MTVQVFLAFDRRGLALPSEPFGNLNAKLEARFVPPAPWNQMLKEALFALNPTNSHNVEIPTTSQTKCSLVVRPFSVKAKHRMFTNP